jgi:hypothetical protein
VAVAVEKAGMDVEVELVVIELPLVFLLQLLA